MALWDSVLFYLEFSFHTYILAASDPCWTWQESTVYTLI